MTTSLSDNNTNPLSTLTFTDDPELLGEMYNRPGKKDYDITTEILPVVYDWVISRVSFSIQGKLASQAQKDLLLSYFLRRNTVGFTWTAYGNSAITATGLTFTGFTSTTRNVWIDNLSIQKVGGTENPFWTYTMMLGMGRIL